MRLGYLIGYGTDIEKSPLNRYGSIFVIACALPVI